MLGFLTMFQKNLRHSSARVFYCTNMENDQRNFYVAEKYYWESWPCVSFRSLHVNSCNWSVAHLEGSAGVPGGLELAQRANSKLNSIFWFGALYFRDHFSQSTRHSCFPQNKLLLSESFCFLDFHALQNRIKKNHSVKTTSEKWR